MSKIIVIGHVDDATAMADALRLPAVWVDPSGLQHGCDYSGEGPFDPVSRQWSDDTRALFIVRAGETTMDMSRRYNYMSGGTGRELAPLAVIVLPVDEEGEPVPTSDQVRREVVELILEGGPSMHPVEWGGELPYVFAVSETGIPEARELLCQMSEAHPT